MYSAGKVTTPPAYGGWWTFGTHPPPTHSTSHARETGSERHKNDSFAWEVVDRCMSSVSPACLSILSGWLASCSVFLNTHAHPSTQCAVSYRHDMMLCYAMLCSSTPFARYKCFLPPKLLYLADYPPLPRPRAIAAGRVGKKKNVPFLLGRGARCLYCMHACMVRRGERDRERASHARADGGWVCFLFLVLFFIIFFFPSLLLLYCSAYPAMLLSCSGM